MGISNILKIFVPKEQAFFPLFEKSADNLVKTAEILIKMIGCENDTERDELIKTIKDHEHIGDEITHQIYNTLNKTFITPFDREDIQGLASELDDVVDFINSTAQRTKLYRPKKFTPEFSKMAEIILEAGKEINIAIKELGNLKNSEKIKLACINIDTLENQADDLYHVVLSHLFSQETDAVELIKKKEILEALEKACDQAEDVSDILKTIIIKFA